MEKSSPAARNSAYIKSENKKSVIKLIRSGAISRAELARKTGLTRASITRIVENLLHEGLIVETGKLTGGAGRNPIMLKLNTDAFTIAGINITRRNCHGGLVGFDGSIIKQFTIDYQEGTSPEELLKKVTKKLLRLAHGKQLLGIGITAPGPVDGDNGVVLNPPNFDLWHNFDVASTIKKYSGAIAVRLENNSAALTLSEMHYGKCREIADFLLLLADKSGIGGGIIMNGRLYKGTNKMGGEVGHTTINFSGPLCFCGNKGCLEAYSQIPRLMSDNTWFNLLENDEKTTDREAEYFSAAIVNALNILDFHTVIMAGGAACQKLREKTELLLNDKKLAKNGRHVNVLAASTFDRNNILPAANLIIEDFIQNMR